LIEDGVIERRDKSFFINPPRRWAASRLRNPVSDQDVDGLVQCEPHAHQGHQRDQENAIAVARTTTKLERTTA
jgi:hypothetical protein